LNRERKRATFAAAAAWILLIAPCAARETVTGFQGGPSTGEDFVAPIMSLKLDTKSSVVVRPTASYVYYGTRDDTGAMMTTAPRHRSHRLSLQPAPSSCSTSDRLRGAHQSARRLIGKTTDQMLMGAAFGRILLPGDAVTSINVAANYDEANSIPGRTHAIKQRVTDLEFQDAWALLLGADLTEQGIPPCAIERRRASGVRLRQGETALYFAPGCAWLDYCRPVQQRGCLCRIDALPAVLSSPIPFSRGTAPAR